MSHQVVSDASALAAALLDSGPDGTWASQELAGSEIVAPALLPFECANIIRRHARAGLISQDQAAQAHVDLLDLPIELWPYEVLGRRVWELRDNLSCYDASYVAVAELVEADLVTLDRRISAATGLRCPVRTPET